jgi:hypothetical protein
MPGGIHRVHSGMTGRSREKLNDERTGLYKRSRRHANQ